MGRIEIKIDRTTLPTDGQIVQFDTAKEQDLIGAFSEGDDLFIMSKSEWKTSFEVCSWEAIDEKIKKLSPDMKYKVERAFISALRRLTYK